MMTRSKVQHPSFMYPHVIFMRVTKVLAMAGVPLTTTEHSGGWYTSDRGNNSFDWDGDGTIWVSMSQFEDIGFFADNDIVITQLEAGVHYGQNVKTGTHSYHGTFHLEVTPILYVGYNTLNVTATSWGGYISYCFRFEPPYDLTQAYYVRL